MFRADISDQQVSRTINATTVLIDNAGRTRAEGVEVQATLTPVRGLTLSADFTIQKAEFRRYQSGSVSFAGNRQLRSPDFAGYFSAEYVVSIDSLGDLTLRGGYSYRSKTFYDLANSAVPGLYAPAYGLSNARATLAPRALSNFEFSTFVRNAGDERYYQNIAANGQSGLAVPGEPRTYGVEVQYRYR